MDKKLIRACHLEPSEGLSLLSGHEKIGYLAQHRIVNVGRCGRVRLDIGFLIGFGDRIGIGGTVGVVGGRCGRGGRFSSTGFVRSGGGGFGWLLLALLGAVLFVGNERAVGFHGTLEGS